MKIEYLSHILSLTLVSTISSTPVDDSYTICMPLNLELNKNGNFTVAIKNNFVQDGDTINIKFADTFSLVDEYGKNSISGTVSNSSISFASSDTEDKQVTYNIENASAGKWSGQLSVSIFLDRDSQCNMLIDGPSINSILKELNPSTISFSHSIINETPLYDLSLAQDNSIQLFKNNNEVIITNKSDKSIKANEDMSKLFSDLALTSINNLDYIDMSDCINMSRMFHNTLGLTSLDVSSFNTSNVENMSYMFDAMHDLVNLTGLENFDVKNVTTFSHFLNDCRNLNGVPDLTNWNVSDKCTNMSYMFYSIAYKQGVNGSSLWPKQVDYTKWDVSNVTNMSYMFTNAFNIETLNITGWNTSNVTNMSYMFHMNDDQELSRLKTIIGIENLDVSEVTNMNYMFNNNRQLDSNNDFSKWKPSSVKKLSHTFYGTWSLDLTDFINWKNYLIDFSKIDTTECFGNYAGYNTSTTAPDWS